MQSRIISLVLVLCLAFTLGISVSAADATPANGDTKIITSNGYTFEITESVDSSGKITRSYHQDNSHPVQNSLTIAHSNPQTIDYSKTKTLLSVLGMEDDFIKELSSEDLDIYKNSDHITGTVMYYKTDASDNTYPVDEATALREAAQLNADEPSNIQPLANKTETYGSIIRVYHATAHQGGGKYLFSTDARWLTMPRFKMKDTIGSCASNCTYTDGTGSGWYTYTKTKRSSGVATPYTYDISAKDMDFVTNQGWAGSAAFINIPENDSYYTYTDYKAHYQYRGKVFNPQLITNFNSVGNYCHSLVSFSISEIAIDFSGKNASIGLSLSIQQKSYSAVVEENYAP